MKYVYQPDITIMTLADRALIKTPEYKGKFLGNFHANLKQWLELGPITLMYIDYLGFTIDIDNISELKYISDAYIEFKARNKNFTGQYNGLIKGVKAHGIGRFVE